MVGLRWFIMPNVWWACEICDFALDLLLFSICMMWALEYVKSIKKVEFCSLIFIFFWVLEVSLTTDIQLRANHSFMV